MMECGERTVAFVAFVLLLPFLAAVAGLTFLLSGSAPLVAHRRLGRNGVPFWMLKFRSMWGGGGAKGSGLIEQLPEERVPEQKAASDPRVTSRFAAFCR